MWTKRRRFHNFKFEDKGVFGGLYFKMSRARHMMGFPSILMGIAKEVVIFRVVGSLGGRSQSVGSFGGKS